MMMTYIIVKTKFEGLHKYADAPDEVSYLKDPHRHLFFVEVKIAVRHDDRELEFLMVKRRLDEHIASWGFNLGGLSCEMMAKRIIKFLEGVYKFRSYEVSVFEDNENGALVTFP